MTQYLNALNPPVSAPVVTHRVSNNTSQATLDLIQAQRERLLQMADMLDQRVRNRRAQHVCNRMPQHVCNRMPQQVLTSIDQVTTQVDQLKIDNEAPFFFTLIAFIFVIFFVLYFKLF